MTFKGCIPNNTEQKTKSLQPNKEACGNHRAFLSFCDFWLMCWSTRRLASPSGDVEEAVGGQQHGLNPVEPISDIMSGSIHQRHIASQTVQELADTLVQAWEEIPQEGDHAGHTHN